MDQQNPPSSGKKSPSKSKKVVPSKKKKLKVERMTRVEKSAKMPSTPFKKNSKLIANILGHIEGGHAIETACSLAGVAATTYLRWRICENPFSDDQLIEMGIPAEDIGNNDRRCWECSGCSLEARTQKAQDKFEETHLNIIRGAAGMINEKTGLPYIDPSTWLLSRRRRQKYATKEFIESTTTIDVGSENARKLAEVILRGAAGGRQ